jgi:hypothetical protein
MGHQSFGESANRRTFSAEYNCGFWMKPVPAARRALLRRECGKY